MKPQLQFNVRNQSISRVDMFHPVKNSRNYLYAQFSFLTSDWNKYPSKTALFKANGIDPIAVLIDDSGKCLVPWEVLEKDQFTVSLYAGDLITVDVATVKLYESGYASGRDVKDPTPTIYEQVMQSFDDTKKYVTQQANKAQSSADSAKESERSASTYASEANSAADRAKQIGDAAVSEINQSKQDAVKEVNSAAENGVIGVNLARDQATKEIEDKGSEMRQTGDSYLNQISETSKAGLLEINQAISDGLESISDAGETQTNAVNQAGSEKVLLINNAGTSRLSEINTAGQKWVSDINQGGESALANIQEKSSEAINGIETARQESVQDVTDEGNTQIGLIRQEADGLIKIDEVEKIAIKEQVEGKVIEIDDSAEWRFNGLNLYGRSTQETTTGAQLFDYEIYQDNYTQNGVTGINNHDGSFTFSGNFDDSPDKIFSWVRVIDDYSKIVELFKPGEIFIGNMQVTTRPYFEFQLRIKNSSERLLSISSISANQNHGIITEEMLANEYLIAIFYFYANNIDITPGTFFPILYQTGDGNYEPYTGGKPAPNPDYPMPIKSVGSEDGDVEVKVSGKNLINYKDIQRHSDFTVPTLIDNGFILDGRWYAEINNVDLPKNKQMIISYITDKPLIAKGAIFKAGLRNERNMVTRFNANTNFVISDNVGNVDILFYSSHSDTEYNTVTYTNIQLELGTTATPYEPYKTPQFITANTPNGLPGIPVNSDGNYTDENGQQWICDEVDFGRGVYVKRVNTKVVDGNGTWNKASNRFIRYILNDVEIGNVLENIDRSFMDKYFYSVNIWDNNSDDYAYCVNYSALHIRDIRFDTVEEFTNYLNLNPCKITYILATPIEIPLTAEELLILN